LIRFENSGSYKGEKTEKLKQDQYTHCFNLKNGYTPPVMETGFPLVRFEF